MIKIDGNGLIQGLSQIQFPAVAVPSSNPNTLDDYIEGTWAPTAVIQPTVTAASFTKIGRLVYITAFLQFPTNSDARNLQLGGLPYPVVGQGPITVGYQNTAQPVITMMHYGGVLNVYAGGGLATFAQFSNGQLFFGGMYQTNT